MSKKTKRQSRRSSASAPRTSQAVSNGASAQAGRGGSLTYEREFSPDYSQTIKDLRRIGVLAGTFFTILIILSFFLR